jgi:hypothetical protein
MKDIDTSSLVCCHPYYFNNSPGQRQLSRLVGCLECGEIVGFVWAKGFGEDGSSLWNDLYFSWAWSNITIVLSSFEINSQPGMSNTLQSED